MSLFALSVACTAPKWPTTWQWKHGATPSAAHWGRTSTTLSVGISSEDFANLFKGLRIDSGDNREQLQLIVNKYKSLNIDPLSKQVIFSNALDTDRAIEIQQYAKELCIPSFGIGTHFTNDFEGVDYLNIVIKLVAVKITESWPFYNDTCKISEDNGKHTGKPEVVKRFMEMLHIN